MIDRWVLARAGIINVYQYGQETFEFAGGRLLLRGVNGSGKSTAMNMLLPFLLEGDTRRIDAAGEQSGVLKSWMLSGRDDPQPVGYLWVEFARGDDHLTCGCGIRASRASDTVTTWWFVTSRRPGVDLDLVEGQHPLSAEALRATLGTDAVYRHDQRRDYRVEVRARLFGGVDIDQHIRLLHVVRNPRVGDRIDVDLPGHLHDALPQLSDAALDDAAQPLDDLEEHRRNVEDLTRTATTLGALGVVYADYARGELRRRAGVARRLVDEHGRARRERNAAERTATAAREALEQAAEDVAGLVRDEARLRSEMEGLRESPAYKDGRELNQLRDHVASLRAVVVRATRDVERRARAADGARRTVDGSANAAGDDARSLGGHLRDLAARVVGAGLPVGPPNAPAMETVPLDGRDGDGRGLDVPAAEIDPAPIRRSLQDLRGAVQHRRGDLDELRAELAAVDQAERRLDEAHRAWEAAVTRADAAREASAGARRSLDDAVGLWRTALQAWVVRLADHHRVDGLDGVAGPDLGTGLAARHEDVTTVLAGAAEATVETHVREIAALEARRAAEQVAVDDLADVRRALDGRVLPSPPTLPWQHDGGGTVLAELIDFRDHVGEVERAGLEAAMEAAGLLGATVTAAGALQLAVGGLVIGPGRAVPEPLGRLLVVTDGHPADVDPGVVAALLDTISTDADALAGASISTGGSEDEGEGGSGSGGVGEDGTVGEDRSEQTVVTIDGHFRTGALRGRHTKPRAEHIGLTARRAALERQRTEARVLLEAAKLVLAGTDGALDAGRVRIADARAIRAALPSASVVARSVLAAELADDDALRTGQARADRRHDRDRAEEVHVGALEKSRRTAANLGLPADPEGLRTVDEDLRQATRLTERADDRLTELVAAVARWRRAGDDWRRAVDDEAQAARDLTEADGEHDAVATRLATLEDSVGVAYAEIVAAITTGETEERRTAAALETARRTQLDRTGEVTAAGARAGELGRLHAEAESRAVAALPGLRRALEVPGLLAAALAGTAAPAATTATPLSPAATPIPDTAPSPDTAPPLQAAGDPDAVTAARTAVLAPVDETPDGTRIVTAAIEAHVPAPDRADVSAEGVRQSLRQRRDSLGAGWDAEDRQVDESLPVLVEVTGPEGRMPLAAAIALVDTRLAELTALLSSQQDGALRNLLQGLVAQEVADKLHAARELVTLVNRRLDTVATSHGIGVSLRWRRRESLDPGLTDMIDLLAKPPDLRTDDQDGALRSALADRLGEARRDDPEAPYRDLIGRVLDYRSWHEIVLLLRRPGRPDERLTRRTALSEGEKKIVSYLPLFAAVAASCDSLAATNPGAPRFVLLDDAFAKVSEDNHPKLFGLLVDLDLDFIVTSERLWGTHATVPELAITEVLRDADLGVIVLEHSRWNGTALVERS